MNMDRYNVGEKRLIAPDNYTSSGTSRNNQKDLVPPSHFESSAQLPRRAVQLSGTVQAPWIHSGITSGDPGTPNPGLAISQAQEILELRRENERLMRLQKENPRENVPVLSPSDSKTRFRWESEWRLEAERHKEEAERLKMQVEVLKSSVERHWEEIRDRDNTMKRQIRDLEAVHEELSKTKSELRQTREELVHSSAQKEKISSQLERLREEAAEESTRLRRDAERSKEEARECALRAEMCRLQAEEEAKQQALKLSEQLSELHQKHEVERQLLNTSHQAELATLGKTTNELQDRLESMTSELLPLKSTLKAITTERDGLKQRLSQMGQAFETQSATLHSLRNYIGQLAPENGEKERLNDTVERLNREKVALQMANELLTIRLNSVNEMLTLQEEKVVEKTLTHPLGKNSSEGLQVLHLWREKVFKLCVQLRTKDIEVNEQKHKLVSNIRSLQQELQQEQHRARLLQHGLDDRIAELDLERVAKETLKQDLAFGQKENLNLKSQNKKVEAELKVLTEAVRRFSQAFESKVADVDSAITRLSTLTQRLAFAKGRVETIQGLVLRKNALRKVQQAGKQSEHPNESVPKLQTELHLVYEERDKLTKELKRTPELIEKALTELREQYESKLGHRQQELEQSWAEVRRAVAGRDEAEHNLQLTQAHLGECRVNLEELSSELLRQQERSDRALVERVSEIESRCAEKLREMEFRVNTAEKEHTKAVKILRQFERQATWKQDEPESKRREIQDEPLRETAGDKARLKTSVDEAGLMGECTRSPTANSEGSPPGMAHQEEARLQQPAHEKLLSLLEELRALSAAVISSSEGSSEEEEEEEKLTAQDDHL
ncbi:coiled-coil alpha-helical rod protein 1 [Takifugu flavidus]|uniref:Coiled-coil alpha-helical rod protein 1 n=1 Tax=Takifugu flavidus TaxID=433684 RepID=A0A5C6P7R8_9TELE|nr:coiled-coil alpha-helical rod protein 1 [Takifugu flavidus]TWW74881.1 Coiled-coil alpha-helical rod protein 1 [Takifugu flavidus]